MAVNLVPNGEYTVNANGTANNSNATAARSTAQFYVTPASVLITSAAAGNWSAAVFQEDGVTRIPVSPNTKYTFSAWLYSGAGVRAHRIQVSERDSGGVAVATLMSTDTAIPAGVWTQRTITFTTTATTVSALLLLVGTAAAAAAETFYADSLTLELVDGDFWTSAQGGQNTNMKMTPGGNLWTY